MSLKRRLWSWVETIKCALPSKMFALAVLTTTWGLAAASETELMDADVDLNDTKSLQRGARTFINYCLSCHSAAYARFNRMAADLNIPEKIVESNMLFTTDKIVNTMAVAMRPEDAEQWFGVPAPDLSVIARARGADWLYTYLLTFYLDPNRPTGVNNVVFPATAMPHALWELQGWQKAVYRIEKNSKGKDAEVLDHLELVEGGQLDEDNYRETVRDLVNFLVYLGEPAVFVRHRLGSAVILFLGFFAGLAYLLKREYWKDVA